MTREKNNSAVNRNIPVVFMFMTKKG